MSRRRPAARSSSAWQTGSALAGAGLERHFPQLNTGDGVALLRHSYALIIGLWQMSAESAAHGLSCPLAGSGDLPPVFSYSYPDELDRALLALWSGTIAGAAAAAQQVGSS